MQQILNYPFYNTPDESNDDRPPTPSEERSMRTMTLDRVYQAEMAKAYKSRLGLMGGFTGPEVYMFMASADAAIETITAVRARMRSAGIRTDKPIRKGLRPRS